MSGIIAVYALVISVLIAQDLAPPSSNNHYSLFKYVFFLLSFFSFLHDAPLPWFFALPPPSRRNLTLLTPCSGFMHLACGISVGATGLAAGYCIGVVGDKGVRAYMEQSRIFVGMVLILIFGEVLGLYGYVSCLSSLLLQSRLLRSVRL